MANQLGTDTAAATSTRPPPPRGVVYGEAVRRFMLRPEATALAAVIVLFIVFSVQPGPISHANLHQRHVGCGGARHRQHRRHASDDRRSLRPLGRRGPRAHLLCRGGADARLRHAADRRGAGGGRRRRPARRDQRRSRRQVSHPFLRRHARHDADLARRADRADRRLSHHGRDSAARSRRSWRARCSAVSGCRCCGSSRSARWAPSF